MAVKDAVAVAVVEVLLLLLEEKTPEMEAGPLNVKKRLSAGRMAALPAASTTEAVKEPVDPATSPDVQSTAAETRQEDAVGAPASTVTANVDGRASASYDTEIV